MLGRTATGPVCNWLRQFNANAPFRGTPLNEVLCATMSNQKLLPTDKELYQRVYEVVHYIWDPIGVSTIPEAHDEYESYLWALHGRTKEGSFEKILEYMKWAATENMGLTFDKETAETAANALLAWKDYIDERERT